MGKTRRKSEATIRLDNTEALDNALYEIAQMRQECKRIDSEADAKINDIKAAAQQMAEPLRARIEKLEAAVFTFVDYNRSTLFADRKSLELNFGIVGFRLSTRISISSKRTLELLKQFGFTEAIRTTEQVDKTVLAAWPEDRLSTVEASRKQDDLPYFEIKEEAVAERTSGTVARRATA